MFFCRSTVFLGYSVLYLKEKQRDWNGRYETPAGKAHPGETPQAQRRRGGSRTARGKRVPGVEIISQTLFQKSVPCPPTVCQASSKQAPLVSRLASYSAGMSQISSIQLVFIPYRKVKILKDNQVFFYSHGPGYRPFRISFCRQKDA